MVSRMYPGYRSHNHNWMANFGTKQQRIGWSWHPLCQDTLPLLVGRWLRPLQGSEPPAALGCASRFFLTGGWLDSKMLGWALHSWRSTNACCKPRWDAFHPDRNSTNQEPIEQQAAWLRKRASCATVPSLSYKPPSNVPTMNLKLKHAETSNSFQRSASLRDSLKSYAGPRHAQN